MMKLSTPACLSLMPMHSPENPAPMTRTSSIGFIDRATDRYLDTPSLRLDLIPVRRPWRRHGHTLARFHLAGHEPHPEIQVRFQFRRVAHQVHARRHAGE